MPDINPTANTPAHATPAPDLPPRAAPQYRVPANNPPPASDGPGVGALIWAGIALAIIAIAAYAAGGGFSGNKASVIGPGGETRVETKARATTAPAVKVGGNLRGQARCDEMFPGQGRVYVGDTEVGGVVGAICRGPMRATR